MVIVRPSIHKRKPSFIANVGTWWVIINPLILFIFVFTGPLKFKVATVPKTGLPAELKANGLRNLPALIHGTSVAIDTVEEIVDYIESVYPTEANNNFDNSSLEDEEVDNVLIDKLTRNLFSR